MVGYKLSKNDWVTPFFVIFRSVREKLLVTVSFDHPVVNDAGVVAFYEMEFGSGKCLHWCCRYLLLLVSVV